MTIETLEKELKTLEENYEEALAIWRTNNYGNSDYQLVKELDEKIKTKKAEIATQKSREVKVGDGVTILCYTDCKAYTVIARTEKTLTIQRDNAVLKPSFKPEFVKGGFSAHCVNDDEQEYIYSPNPNGEIMKLRWSDKYNCWKAPKGYKKAILGRYEYYDYNF